MKESKGLIVVAIESRLREIGGNTYLIPLDNRVAKTSKLFTLNKVGKEIWNYLELKHQVQIDEICEFILGKYEDVDAFMVKSDIDKFVHELREFGFVKEIS